MEGAAAPRSLADVPDPIVSALVWRTKAEAETYLGRLKHARKSYGLADTEARRAEDFRLLGEILVGRTGVLHALGDAEAAPLVDEAKQILERTDHLSYLARLHMNLGSAAFHREDASTAYSEFHLARSLFDRIGQRDATSMSLLVNLGSACTELLRLTEAREVLTEVEGFADESALAHLGAHARLDLSFVDRLEGRYRDALSRLERAEFEFDAAGAHDLKATTQLTRAEIKLELGLASEAYAHSREAGAAFEAQEKILDRDHARIIQGRSLARLRRFPAARSIFEALLLDATSRGWRERRLSCLLELAQIELSARKPERVLDLLGGRRFSLASARLSAVARAEAALARAEAHLSLGHPGRASRSIAPLLGRMERLPLRVQCRLLLLAGRVARHRQEFPRSRRLLDRAVHLSEQLRATIPGIELRAAAFHEDARIHRERVEAEVEAVVFRQSGGKRAGKAADEVRAGRARRSASTDLGTGAGWGRSGVRIVEWTRRARARSFFERRERLPLSPDLERLRSEIGSLSRLREEREYDPALTGPTDDLDARIGQLEARFLRDYRRWEAGLPGGERSELGAPSAPRGRVSSGVSVDGPVVVVEYFLAVHSALAVVTTSSGVTVTLLPARVGQIETAVEGLRFQLDLFASLEGRELAHPESLRRAADGALGQLHELLIAPLLSQLEGATRIRVVPHSVLHHVPYACLFDGARYLSEQFEIEVSVSGRAAPLPKRLRKAVLAANVNSGPTLAVTEVRRIGTALGARARIVEDPTVEDILRELKRGSVVHLATHGTFRDDNPFFTRLTLSDRSLFVSDLSSVRLDTDLLVLSSCDSGRTFGGQGDDLQGLAHAFLSSGIRRLVASLWRVDDAATLELMERFYQHLFTGPSVDPATALRAAMLEVRVARPHPFLWGGFVVFSG